MNINELNLPQPIDFDWDIGNNNKSLNKHGVSNQEAEKTFLHDNILIPDQRHSKAEVRFGMYGKTDKGKMLFIIFTIRGQRVRIISARPTNKREKEAYEESFKKTA